MKSCTLVSAPFSFIGIALGPCSLPTQSTAIALLSLLSFLPFEETAAGLARPLSGREEQGQRKNNKKARTRCQRSPFCRMNKIVVEISDSFMMN